MEAVKQARQPGKIFNARKDPGDETKQIMYKSQSQEFSDALLLLDDMIVDHLHTSYQVTLQNVQI